MQSEPMASQVQDALTALLRSHSHLTSLKLSEVPVAKETEALHIGLGVECTLRALQTLRILDLDKVQASVIDVSGCSQLSQLRVKSAGMYNMQFAFPQSLQAVIIE